MFRLPLAGTCVALSTFAAAQSTTIATRSPADTAANGDAFSPTMSADARFVAFATDATNLDPADTNGFRDVYVRDRVANTNERISLSSAGGTANGSSQNAAISADGRYVVFTSTATNLTPTPGITSAQIYLRDRALQTTQLVSVTPAGAPGNGAGTYGAISRDGRFVVFASWASDIVPGDANGHEDAFVRDLQAGTTVCASVDQAGIPRGALADGQTGENMAPSISANGQFVAFASFGSIVPGVSGTRVFVRDLVANSSACVSISSTGVIANSDSWGPALTPDGRFVVFTSLATNLAPVHGPNWDVFVHDRWTAQTAVASLTAAGTAIDSFANAAAITPDGRFIAFASNASNIVAGDANGSTDIFVRDTSTGAVTRVSVDSIGAQATSGSAPDWFPPALSDDGQRIAFRSNAPNLVPFDGNNLYDAFVHDRTTTLVSFCGADGIVDHACPCADGAPGNGCANSAFASGARLVASGDTSVSNDTVQLDASGLTGNVCVFFLGDTAIAPFAFDDGLTCAGGAIVRLASKPVGGNASVYPEPGDAQVSVAAGMPAIGGRRFVQCVYRNTASFCTSATSNRANAVAITFVP